ncbi:MAG: peptide ABC transporter substrate-binding protein [Firmicutes bacterium]|nr:peptide ABC transporter substrate-binding protein [Bacillota bacterium]
MKRLLAAVLTLTMVFALAACGGNSGAADSATTGAAAPAETAAPVTENAVYRTLYASEVTTLNYLITGRTNELTIAANVVDCLVEYDSYGNVQAALATDWEQNEDATVWTFHIREGVNWVDKDGNVVAPVTANDWVSSARYVCDAANDSDTFYLMGDVVAGANAYYDWTAYQMALPTATDGTDENGNPVKIITDEDGEESVLEEVPEASVEDIGVKALDDYTLEFTLESPRPYFLSMVSFGPYMPVYGPFLEQCGSKFGTDNSNLLYNGAFVLSTYQPQQQRVLTKNASYWDKDNVFLDAIQMTYNAEASSISTTMYQSGEVDQADVSSNLLSAMMADPATKDLIHPTRSDTSYAYWYLFNFDPNFDEEYEPENWNLAVNNENFRKSIVHAFNRMPALATNDRIDPESLKCNTITPSGFASASKDYAYYGDLAKYTEGDNFDADLALEYKEKAVEELTAAGATFPVKMLMCFNPTSPNWAEECQVVEQTIENILGSDYVDIIVQAGPETGFLSAIRRSGKYAFMKCNWGADYADPETWTDPFISWTDSNGEVDSNSYSFICNSTDPTTQALYAEYMDLVNAAKAITDPNEMDARYEAFAKAEAFLLDHAFAIPFSISNRSYQMCNLNTFEGQYASFGMANLRYKGEHLYSTSMSLEQYQQAYADWQAKMAG